jgi:hypothetical protein
MDNEYVFLADARHFFPQKTWRNMTPKEQKLWRARLQILRLKRRPPVSKKKKHRRPVPKTCDPNLCDHCMYLGEGDFVCDLNGLGPEETVFVMEDWEPTEHFLQCVKEARHE